MVLKPLQVNNPARTLTVMEPGVEEGVRTGRGQRFVTQLDRYSVCSQPTPASLTQLQDECLGELAIAVI